jgi:hypothetical protein
VTVSAWAQASPWTCRTSSRRVAGHCRTTSTAARADPGQAGQHLADRTSPSAAIAGASAIGAALRRWRTGEAPSYANTENGPLLAWSRGAPRKVVSSRLMCPRSPNYISANHEKPMRVKCRWRNADRLIEKSLMTACAHRVKFGTVAPAES